MSTIEFADFSLYVADDHAPASMGIDQRGTYHGQLRGCRWTFVQRFKCVNCERWVCYCGGHDSGTPECETHCDDCCPCDDGDEGPDHA